MTEPYYQDDFVTLYLGDALELTDELDDGCLRAVITDPPFSSGGRRENARSIRKSLTRSFDDDDWIAGDAMSTTGFVWTMRELAKMARPKLLPGGHLLMFIDWRMHGNLSGALESADYRQHPTLVWNKMQFGMGTLFRNQHEFIVHFSKGNPLEPARRDVGNVLSVKPIRGGEHPTEKPVPLMESLVSVVCPPGTTVLDPFTGSGSTLVGAKRRGVKAVGYELDERWLEVAARRLAEELPLVIETVKPEAPQPGLDLSGWDGAA